MAKIKYSQSKQRIYWIDGENMQSWECRCGFEEGYSPEGLPRETLPIGHYTVWAEDYETACNNGEAYGTGYIHTGDYRGRDIHGGGSSCEDPYAPRQGWFVTYGCLRMQNEDIEALSRLIRADGNEVELDVEE